MTAEGELLIEMTSLLDAMAKLIGEQAQMIHQQAHRLAELDQEYQTTTAMANRANDTLRDLVQIVDPTLWRDGRADMHELVAQVRIMATRS